MHHLFERKAIATKIPAIREHLLRQGDQLKCEMYGEIHLCQCGIWVPDSCSISRACYFRLGIASMAFKTFIKGCKQLIVCAFLNVNSNSLEGLTCPLHKRFQTVIYETLSIETKYRLP